MEDPGRRYYARVGGAALRKPTMNRDRILQLTYRKCQPPGATAPPHARAEPGGGWGPPVSPRYSENFDTRSWAWNTSGGELYVALEGVAPQPPEGRDHAEEKPMAPAAGAPPRRKEWVCRSKEEWNAAWRMGPKRARVKYDPARKANTGQRRWGVCQAIGVTQ